MPGREGKEAGEGFPLTDAQAEKWLGSRYSAQAALAFGEAFELRFEGCLDVARLQAAFDAVVARHQALAVRFTADGQAQVHEPARRVRLRHMDLSTSGDPMAEYLGFCREQMGQPFDLGQAPLVRTCLCRLSATRHYLFMAAHHLVMDGWSLRIVLKEMAAYYNAKTPQAQAKIPAADSWEEYARNERLRRGGEEGVRCLRYWREQFQTLPEPLRLPTDRPRTAHIDFAASSFSIDADVNLWQGLRDMARRLTVTRFSVLLGAYFALLHRLTGQVDLVCGIPFAGAAQGAGARVVGDTDNTLPLRVQVDPGMPLSTLIDRVHEKLKEASEHQDISLGRIVDALKLPREAGRMLLLESIVTLAPAMDRLHFDGVECGLNVMPRIAAAWELGFYWRQTPGALLLEVQYQRELYDESTVRDWASMYMELLRIIVDGCNESLEKLDITSRLPANDYALINDSIPEFGDTASVPALLKSAFDRHAGRRAVECGRGSIDYATLERRSRRLAAGLLASGVKHGELIGIALPRSIDMLVAVVAAMRAGAAYVPLDPAFPEQRLQRMAEHSGLARIIVAEGTELPESLCKGRKLWRVDMLEASGSGSVELPEVRPDDLAYVLYTSGSTGEPKGVRILHRNLVNFLCAMREAPGFSSDDAICAATTLSFDIAALELYLPLLCGGRVVIADDNEHRDPEALCRLIERSGCSVFQTTPSLIALLQETGRTQVLAPLRLLVGGEALPLPLAKLLLTQCRELWNMYGPTETTVWSSIQRMQLEATSVPLGQPIARTRMYVLDTMHRPTPPHALGEIWIGGAGVADGYLHSRELSEERFIPDPFIADGSRMYRTGDLGRLHEGQLSFHGRVDEQIKLRGYRIEPGDIEAAATAEEGVLECVAVARRLQGGDQVLVLYVGSDAPQEGLSKALHARLRRELPAYMRPQYVEVMSHLPKTPNGKIDRKSLPAPSTNVAVAQRTCIAPRDALERELCELWQRLLQSGPVGVEDDFFELGGYSLLAVRMFTELHQRYGVDLPLATLIGNPSVAALAEAVSAAMRSASNEDGEILVPLQSGGAKPPLFLFHAVGGNVMNYCSLLHELDADQPVYGLQSAGLDGAKQPLQSISEMADLYVGYLLRAHPAGPFLLGGGSMGGILALEAARRLHAQGREVVLLAMFDTFGPDYMAYRSPGDFWRSLWRMDAAQYMGLWHRLGLRVLQLLQLPLFWYRRNRRPSAALPLAVRLYRVEKANYHALSTYVPEKYAGDMQLFRTRVENEEEDVSLGWRNWVGGNIEISQLPGRHHNFVDQPELAACLKQRIAKALDRP
ncbi:non-ribosomal peptide synthetase [Pseudoxanthomonas kalamensis]|uniref:non-ribosomal peptide synthetase n=1 Tax=Pseudoxanthomonas kalamensis TaxID=289483 RepID=UPI0013918FFA|nr:non-ribosomal peptide synthetase [Pseudoxanthomonas kalamensis]